MNIDLNQQSLDVTKCTDINLIINNICHNIICDFIILSYYFYYLLKISYLLLLFIIVYDIIKLMLYKKIFRVIFCAVD